jgi:hypothetical protein
MPDIRGREHCVCGSHWHGYLADALALPAYERDLWIGTLTIEKNNTTAYERDLWIGTRN